MSRFQFRKFVFSFLPIYLPVVFVLVFITALLTKPSFAQFPPDCTTKADGDANCDAKIDLQDFEYWRREFIGEYSSKYSDFDKNTRIDLRDFEAWRRYITKIVTSPTPDNITPISSISPTVFPSPTIQSSVNDFGPYNPQEVPVELQTFFTPRPDNGRGYGSLHILCKWPLGQKVTGTIKTNCRISLHNNPSTLRLLRFDLTPGEIVKKIELGNKNCPFDGVNPAVCAWNVPVEFDTSFWKRGWRHLRVRATLQTVSEDGFKTWTTSSELPFHITNSSGIKDEDDADDCRTNCFEAGSSYEGKNDDRNVLIKNIPPGKIRGTYIFYVSPGKTENPPSRRLNVYLDRNYDIPAVNPWPKEAPNNGSLLLDLPDPDPKKSYQVQIDSTRLANGWHSLSVGTVGTKPEKVRCRYCSDSVNYQSAVGKFWFYVEN